MMPRLQFRWSHVQQSLFYGLFLLAGEVCFYPIVRLGKMAPAPLRWLFAFEWTTDPRLGLGHMNEAPFWALFGQASLWMIPVYGSTAAVVHAAYLALRSRTSRLVRFFVYAAGIGALEYAWGWLLYWLTGYAIWLYVDGWAIGRFTSLAILPLWGITGVLLEPLIVSVERHFPTGTA